MFKSLSFSLSQDPMNEYGHHPYYMVMEDDQGNSHSVLLYNSNAMGNEKNYPSLLS